MDRLNKSRSTLVSRAASAVLSELLSGPVMRGNLAIGAAVSEATIDKAVAFIRCAGIEVDTKSGKGAGCVYSLRSPDVVRRRLAGALRLSIGDLIAGGGVAPALGVGLLIEAGAL